MRVCGDTLGFEVLPAQAIRTPSPPEGADAAQLPQVIPGECLQSEPMTLVPAGSRA